VCSASRTRSASRRTERPSARHAKARDVVHRHRRDVAQHCEQRVHRLKSGSMPLASICGGSVNCGSSTATRRDRAFRSGVWKKSRRDDLRSWPESPAPRGRATPCNSRSCCRGRARAASSAPPSRRRCGRCWAAAGWDCMAFGAGAGCWANAGADTSKGEAARPVATRQSGTRRRCVFTGRRYRHQRTTSSLSLAVSSTPSSTSD